MAKKKKKGKKKMAQHAAVRLPSRRTTKSEQDDVSGAARISRGKMKRKEFDPELKKLQVELVKMQEWVKASGAKLCVLFEGRDAAGKGGIIKRITERTSPRVFRVVALSAPTEREQSQMYMQRYIRHLPAAGEVVLFDRSWYNRAGAERVMGFASEEEVETFLKYVPAVERAIIASGVILVKYWLEETMEDQTERFTERIVDYRKIWKLSPMDLESHRRWYDYSRARDAMFAATEYPRIALVRRRFAPPTARAPELYRTLAEFDPIRGSTLQEGKAAQALSEGRLRGTGPSIPLDSRDLLRRRSFSCQKLQEANQNGTP